MGEIYFVSEDPTIHISRYSSRISRKVWESYLPTIQCLHDKGLTRREILNELSKRRFNPSFGQLVAQMIRWGLVRYSKPQPILPYTQAGRSTVEFDSCQKDYRTSPPMMRDIPRGIMGVSSILLANEAVPCMYQVDGIKPAYQLSELISNLHIASDGTPRANGSDDSLATNNQVHKQRSQLLDAADLLFLGGSYAHAYHTYRDAYRLDLFPVHANHEDEQLFVQAIIGCLKSAATSEQREESIDTAQEFLDRLEFPGILSPNVTSTTSPPPPCLRKAFETWDSNDCATSKAIFDLLTSYKLNRRWTTTGETAWAHHMTVQEWMCMRLVRIPLWQDLVNFNACRSPFSILYNGRLEPSAVFDIENLASVLQWTAIALAEIGPWYNEQVSTLQAAVPASTCDASASTSISASHSHALLFWRLAFFSKHSNAPNEPPRPCPALRVRLSTDIVFHAHSLQTASVIAHVLLDGDNNDDGSSRCSPSQQFGSATSVQRLKRMQAALEVYPRHGEEWILSIFWLGLKAKLAPAFAQRSENA